MLDIHEHFRLPRLPVALSRRAEINYFVCVFNSSPSSLIFVFELIII